MNLLFPLLTISLIIFIIYNLNIIELSKIYCLFLLVLSYIIVVPFLNYEKLGLPVLGIILAIALYIKTQKLIPTIISVILSLTVIILIDSLSIILILDIFLMNETKNIRDSFTYYIILYSLEFIFASFICFIFSKFFKRKVKLKELTFKSTFSIFVILSLLLTFLIFYTNSVLFFNSSLFSEDQVELNLLIFLLYFILLILIYYVLSKNVKKESEFIHRKTEFENLKEYTQNIESLYNEMRAFKHDYINILASMADYIERDDMIGLSKYFENNIVSINKDIENRGFKLGLIQNIKISEVKGIVSSKVIKAYEKEINIFIDIAESINYINMDIIDLCRIIGILLDNAIEAAEKTDVKSLDFSIVKKKDSIAIIVINSCSEDTPPIFKIYAKNFSTKGSDRGLGLGNLKQILSHYNNTFLDTSLETNKFMQFLEIKNY